MGKKSVSAFPMFCFAFRFVLSFFHGTTPNTSQKTL